MYKLLIIDDEPVIRQGLRTIIDWSAYGVQVGGEADNGIDGLRLCMELQPDIAIVDVKMPGMDGLQLIERAIGSGLLCDFLVLSGYSEFTYAQKAMEFGVRSFLLKPIQTLELTKKIEWLRQEWDRSRLEKERLRQTARIRAEIELQLILSLGKPTVLDRQQYDIVAVELGLPWSRYHMILIGGEARVLEEKESVLLQTLLRDSCFPDRSKGCVLSFGAFVCLLSELPVPADILNHCLSRAEAEFGLQLIVSCGSDTWGFDQLPVSFHVARDRMKNKFFYGRSGRMLSGKQRWLTEDIEYEAANREELASDLAQAVASGNSESLIHSLDRTERSILQSCREEQQVKAAFIALYADVMNRLIVINENMKDQCPPLHDIVCDIESHTNVHEIRRYVEMQLVHRMAEWNNGRSNEGFAAILRYVAEHYNSDLTLKGLSAVFHYNKTYLGKLFKHQTGKSFGAYLDNIRMEQAMLLLAKGAKVYEVASQVGYATVDYFHLKFKKHVGQSPSAYRAEWNS